jgi:tetratricopeptide (TPR) repeat protein
MKLLSFLNLEPKEEKLLKQVFIISSSICLLFILITSIMHRIAYKKIDAEEAIEEPIENDISFLYRSKNGNLLPIDIDAHKVAANQYADDRNYSRIIKHYLRILSIENENRKIKLDLGTIYLKSGMYSEAEKVFEEILRDKEKDSLTDKAMARYSINLFYLGKVKRSIEELNKTIEMYPSSAEANCYKGQVEASLDRTSGRAEQYFKKSIELNPDFAETWYQLARYYMNKPKADSSDFIEARLCLLAQLKLEPLNAKVHSRLGMVYYYLGKPGLAEKSYQTALSINPDDYNTHYNLGELYYTFFDDSIRAMGEFLKTIKINKNHVEANFKAGLVSLENKNYKEAIRFFKTALEQSPSNVRILFQLAVAYEKNEMVSDAISIYNSILNFDALNEIAHHKIKLLSYKK